MTDADVEHTLREIREQALANIRSGEPDARIGGQNVPLPAVLHATPAVAPGDSFHRLRSLARPLRRPVRWVRAIVVRVIQSSLADLRATAAHQEQRLHQLEQAQLRVHQLEEEQARLRELHRERDDEGERRFRQLEEEQVRLRQMVLRANELAELADRGRRKALLRLEELEANRQGNGRAAPDQR